VDVFQLVDGDAFFQANVPTSLELRDYKEAMHRVFERIAQSQNRRVEELILEMLNPVADVVMLRVVESGLDGGSLAFDDAIRLYTNARKLVRATANDLVSHKLRHRGRSDRGWRSLSALVALARLR